MDRWTIEANFHLMAQLMRRALAASGYDAAQTRRLVAAKNAWSSEMAKTAVDGGVDLETQQGVWQYHLRCAEDQIKQMPKPKRDAFAERADLA